MQRILLMVHSLIGAAFGALIGLIILNAKLKVCTCAAGGTYCFATQQQ